MHREPHDIPHEPPPIVQYPGLPPNFQPTGFVPSQPVPVIPPSEESSTDFARVIPPTPHAWHPGMPPAAFPVPIPTPFLGQPPREYISRRPSSSSSRSPRSDT